MKVINPATEELIQEIPEDTPKDVSEKFERAKSAQRDWQKTPLDIKKRAIQSFGKGLIDKNDALARTQSLETGKPIQQAKNEIKATLDRVDFFLEKTEEVLAPERVAEKKGSLVEEISFEPLGTIANISAWNYPYFVGANVFLPALLTGNTVLYKPSEFSTLTGIAISELLWESGIPKDVFIPVIGSGQTGSSLLDQPIDGVFFTGSYATGKKIHEHLSGRFVKIQLELGGKDPVYVCEDVDVQNAAESLADGAFYNTGQSCCSVERIYVHEAIYESFIKAFLEVVGGFKVGDPLDSSTYIGPLTRKPQLDVIEDQIKDALTHGAEMRCGGKRGTGRGYYFEPTVFSNVTHKMKLMREESFGPVIGIQSVKNDAEALTLMNDTDYGLTAGVFTRNQNRAHSIMSELNAGSVYWNCCDRVSPRLPWSGRKGSGMGLTLSTHGIRAFTQLKAWHNRFPRS